MASSTIHSIDSALDDLALLMVDFNWMPDLICQLKGLKTFLHCATKLGDPNMQVSLESLLLRIDDAISSHAPKIQPYCRGLEDPNASDDCLVLSYYYLHDIMPFLEEIDERYTILSDSLQLHQSCPLTIDELIEIFDYVLESNPVLVKFRNFIRFVTMHSVEHQQWKSFVIHIAAVAIKGAQLIARLSYSLHQHTPEVREIFEIMLQKIKPIETRVFETYKTALASLKSSTESQHCGTQDHDHHLVIMKDFVDFLIWNLLQIPTTDSCLMTLTKDQEKLLFDGLRYLRTIMKMQPNKFDEIIRVLSRVVLCDAGVLVFSLYQKDAQIDVDLADLLEKFKMISVEVDVQIPDTSILNLPRTSILDFLKFLFDCLMELKSSTVDPDVQSHIQTIEEDMAYLTSVLEDLVEMQNQDEDLQALWNHGVLVASKMKVLIDQLVLGDIPNSFSTNITSFKTRVLESFHDRRQEIKVWKVTQTLTALMPPHNSAPATDEVVGLKNETRSIVDRLTRGSKKLQVIAIVGMPGLGKTLLATKVYNDLAVKCHFPVRQWCIVSQVYNRMKSLLELLNHNMHLEKSEHDLSQDLWRSLKGHRYLIFLDDVWDIKALESLKESLPDDYTGSRILVTSRYQNVAPNEEPHFLRHLNSTESWELLQKKLLPRNDCPQVLSELGKEIAIKCKGLPLTVVIVAGILATLEPEPDIWKKVLESLNSGIMSVTDDQCINALEMSYKHLPEYLKHCFLYFGLFSEDEEVSVKKLIWLWIAEGFVNKTGLESLEDVALGYMMNLACRSLIIVSKRSKARGKICRIHDLLREFCIRKAKEENFFQLLKGYDEILAFKEPYYLPRLCIHSKMKDFEYLGMFHANIHSLLLFEDHYRSDDMTPDISFISSFKNLKVLYVPHSYFGSVFPINMQLLIQLRYLEIQGEWDEVPSSIGNLSNLETFIVDSTAVRMFVALPNTIWNLHRLRHLHVLPSFEVSTENLDNSSSLLELQSCYKAVVFSRDSREKLMRKFPNVEKLKWELCEEWDTENCNKILIHDSLAQLKSVHICALSRKSSWDGCGSMLVPPQDVEVEFSFPPNLKKLTLKFFELSRREISSLGKLPNLEVLKLIDIKFHGGRFDMVEGEFLKIRFLKLASRNLVRWTADDDQFPNLQKLVLEEYENLGEIPSCLENTSMLEMIEVLNCPESVEELVKEMHDVQKDCGNSDLETHITNWSREIKEVLK